MNKIEPILENTVLKISSISKTILNNSTNINLDNQDLKTNKMNTNSANFDSYMAVELDGLDSILNINISDDLINVLINTANS